MGITREIIRVSQEEIIEWILKNQGGMEKFNKAYNEVFISNLQAPFMDNLDKAVNQTDKTFAEMFVRDKFKDKKIVHLNYIYSEEINNHIWVEIGYIVEMGD